MNSSPPSAGGIGWLVGWLVSGWVFRRRIRPNHPLPPGLYRNNQLSNQPNPPTATPRPVQCDFRTVTSENLNIIHSQIQKNSNVRNISNQLRNTQGGARPGAPRASRSPQVARGGPQRTQPPQVERGGLLSYTYIARPRHRLDTGARGTDMAGSARQSSKAASVTKAR